MGMLKISLIALVELIIFDFEFIDFYLLELHLLIAYSHFFVAIVFSYLDLLAELFAFVFEFLVLFDYSFIERHRLFQLLNTLIIISSDFLFV